MKDLDTITAVADYLGYADRSGAWKWLKAEDVRTCQRGRRTLVRKADVDAALERKASGNTVARAKAMQGRA